MDIWNFYLIFINGYQLWFVKCLFFFIDFCDGGRRWNDTQAIDFNFAVVNDASKYMFKWLPSECATWCLLLSLKKCVWRAHYSNYLHYFSKILNLECPTLRLRVIRITLLKNFLPLQNFKKMLEVHFLTRLMVLHRFLLSL